MPNQEFNEDLESEGNESQQQNQESQPMRALREKLAAAETKANQLGVLQKENALLKLGVDPETPTVKLFLKAHDDFSDIAAVKAAMQEYGILQSETDQAQADQAAQQRVSQAGTSGAPAEPVTTGPDWGSMKTEAEVIAAVAAAGGTVYFD